MKKVLLLLLVLLTFGLIKTVVVKYQIDNARMVVPVAESGGGPLLKDTTKSNSVRMS